METRLTRTTASRRVIIFAGLAVVAAIAGLLVWVSRADDRRVDAACGDWIRHRDSLRTAISETDEAVGRATSSHARRVERYYNDFDRTGAALDQWRSEGARLTGLLDRGAGDDGLDHDLAFALTEAGGGVAELQRLIESSEPSEVKDWLPELSARFQNVDDLCLAAARAD